MLKLIRSYVLIKQHNSKFGKVFNLANCELAENLTAKHILCYCGMRMRSVSVIAKFNTRQYVHAEDGIAKFNTQLFFMLNNHSLPCTL